MRILNIFKTYRRYKIWKKVINLNKKELLQKGFLINWINELGIVIELSNEDIDDLNVVYSQNPFAPDGIFFDGPEKNMANTRIKNFLEKHNTFFLETGLLELLEEEFIIEKSTIKDYTYYITLSFEKFYFPRFITNTILIILAIISLYLVGIYFIH